MLLLSEELRVSTKPFRVYGDSEEGLRVESSTLEKFFHLDRENYLDVEKYPLK